MLAKAGHAVTLWGTFPDYVDFLKRKRENVKFLPGVPIPPGVTFTADLKAAWKEPEVVVVAVPSRYLRQVLERAREAAWGKVGVVSVVKGIEPDRLLRMSELIREVVAPQRLAVLSGPSLSYEVARGVPTTVVSASEDLPWAQQVQALFTTEQFRVYTSSDVVGVELGGALKNVIAIACGAADGLGFGANTKAALATRGLVEMARLGKALGADPQTFSGLSGLGDLITTCFSPHSRNRSLGERIGRGVPAGEATQGMEQVAEGVPTTASAYALSRRHAVEMPITQAVYQVLYENKPAGETVRELMTRPPKPE